LTGFFLYVILGATDTRAPEGFAPIAIGLSLTLIHLISIPIDNPSVNPARSTGVAFFNDNEAPGQLWLFWVAPIIGATIAGATYAIITGVHREDREVSGDVSSARVQESALHDPRPWAEADVLQTGLPHGCPRHGLWRWPSQRLSCDRHLLLPQTDNL
jgi:aquaporin Z